MNKKSLFFWFVAFVCAALIFTGCPQEADDDPEPTAAEKAAAELGATLGSDKATVSGTTVTLTADYTVTGAATLAVPAGVKLVVADETTFEVEGTLNNSGEIEVASGGDYVFGADADGTNSGTITIKSGGQTHALGGSLGGDGHTVVETGGKAWTGDALVIGAAGDTWTVSGNTIHPALVLEAASSLALNNAGYTLTGAGTVNGIPGAGTGFTFLVGDPGRKLTVKAGGALTVPGTNSESDKHILVVNIGNGNPGIVGEPAAGGKAAAKIVLASYGYIDIYASGGAYSGDTSSVGHNFYDSESTKLTSNSLYGTTYNWDGTLGNNAGGWKAAVAD